MGIEPTCSAWKADILPLNYTCDCQTFVNQPLNYITGTQVLSRVFSPKNKKIIRAANCRPVGAYSQTTGAVAIGTRSSLPSFMVPPSVKVCSRPRLSVTCRVTCT